MRPTSFIIIVIITFACGLVLADSEADPVPLDFEQGVEAQRAIARVYPRATDLR